MRLVGDAMEHAICPVRAIGFFFCYSGLNLFAMRWRGWSLALSWRSWRVWWRGLTELKEDARLATFYLASLELWRDIVSIRANQYDLRKVFVSGATSWRWMIRVTLW